MKESQITEAEGDAAINNDSIDDGDSEVGDETRRSHAPNQEDNTALSSGNESDNGKGTGSGSGSGGGYSADCSSSDASTDAAAKRPSNATAPQNEMQNLRLSEQDNANPNDREKFQRKRKNSHAKSKGTTGAGATGTTTDSGGDFVLSGPAGFYSKTSLPQWNGVKIQHPMDPRIDLSTVGRVQASRFSAFAESEKVRDEDTSANNNNEQSGEESQQQTSVPRVLNEPAPPSVDQYITLMEVVRPFFHAHGIADTGVEAEGVLQELGAEPPGERHTNNEDLNSNPGQDTASSHSEADGSSMVVLARAKRKHLRNCSPGDSENERSSSHSSNGTGSDRRVQIQQAESIPERDTNENDGALPNDNAEERPEEARQEVRAEIHGEERQDSTSSSSSQNGPNMPAQDPLGFNVPAVVSEYSSSRVGSGNSNTNQTSTSGSGSGGNTGSGTGSGSNQGSSSGSGNDQGISSNGNGSSGSGNDAKGSGEETTGNSGENNSGEGVNSDETNSKDKEQNENREDTAVYPAAHEVREHRARAHLGAHAARERKLIDKKRKRMNMRREYEEKVEQEMESSGSSREQDENTHFKPGRPVTLDKVLSFTKTARIVLSATPPFLVIHANAAFCRLSGTDSHAIIGKSISNILSIPDTQTLAGIRSVMLSKEFGSGSEDEKKESSDDNIKQQHPSSVDSIKETDRHVSRERQGHTAAEAAGRARAAASEDDSVERLIVTSGFGKYNIINLSAKLVPDHTFHAEKKSETSDQSRNREEGSKGSSITSNSVSYRQVTCSMGISPVVSSPEAFALPFDKDQESHYHKPKRRKHHSNETPTSSSTGHQPHPRQAPMHREISITRKQHLITHYVLQLEPIGEGGSQKLLNVDSQSSNSTEIEAQRLGLTKTEVRKRRRDDSEQDPAGMRHRLEAPVQDDYDEVIAGQQEDAMHSDSSAPHEAVTAVG